MTSFLIERAGAQHSPLDRWHGTPLQDAERSGHAAVATYLAAQGAVSGAPGGGAPGGGAPGGRAESPEDLRRGNAIFYRVGARAPRENVHIAETFYDIFVRLSQAHACIYARTQAHMHAGTQGHRHAPAHAHAHAHALVTCTCTCTRTRTCTCTCTCTCT